MSAPTSLPFPTRCCSRCGGSGRYSYNSMHGDRCYGCNGTGRQLAGKKAGAIAAEVQDRIRRAKEPQISGLAPGDLIRLTPEGRPTHQIRNGGEWVEVLDVTTILGDTAGWSQRGETRLDRTAQWGVRPAVLIQKHRVSITLVDGRTLIRESGSQMVRRKATDAIWRSDAARLLAACPKAHRSAYEAELVEAGWNLEELR